MKKKDIISIHVPRVEDDYSGVGNQRPNYYFNPRPPCGGRHISLARDAVLKSISIHVPRVEDDASRIMLYCFADLKFQSTSPVWRTTK